MKYLILLRVLFLSFVTLVVCSKLIENTSAAKADPKLLADEETSMPRLVMDSSTEKEPILLIGE
jgi:hypothetical protein